MKNCPFCAEEIQDEAKICRFCQRDLAAPPVAPTQPGPAGGMRKGLPSIVRRPGLVVLVLALVVVVCASVYYGGRSTLPAPAAVPSAPAGWTTHTDPMGFAVQTPADWRVVTDRRYGRIGMQGPQGEQVVVWPMFLGQQQMNAANAGVVVQQLARTLDPQMPWGAPELSDDCARVVGRGPQRSGVTMIRWASASAGTTVFVYGLEAPVATYASLAQTFTAVLASFRITPGPSGGEGGGATPATPRATPTFVRWTDPRESAFSLSVPNGWKVAGGAYRLSATDIREAVTMLSDDGIRISISDPNIGAFTQPTQMLAYAGLREGGTTSLGDGTILPIQRFVSGQQFARQYAQGALSRVCGPISVTASNDREDLRGGYAQQAQSEGIGVAQLSVGDVAFTCSPAGRSLTGYYVAVTMIPVAGSPLWYVYRLFGYVAPVERQQEAAAIGEQVVRSWQVNPEWTARERQIAAAAVQQDNLRSQQIRSRALAAIAEDLRETSDIVTSGYWARQRVYDEISRKRENGILGTVDVVDPSSGRQYKIGYNADYHWMDNQGNIVGTLTASAPGPGWRKMIDLP